MFTAISQHVESVRESLQRLVIGRAIANWATMTLVAGVVLSIADYAIGISDTGLRWLLTTAFIAAAVGAALKILRPALRYRPSAIDAARWLETSFPEMKTQLSSSVEFLNREQTGNSTSLQRRVLSETENCLTQLDVHRAINRKPIAYACSACLAVVLCLLIAGIAAPRTALAGACRLLTPWSSVRWPREHLLVLENVPSTVARGTSVSVEVRDVNGHLPEEVMLQVRFSFQPEAIADYPMVRSEDLAEFTLDNLQGDIAIRAVGGDDDSMIWHTIAVVDAPHLKKVTLIATPPAYSDLPATEVADGAAVLAETSVHLTGEASESIGKAWLHVTPDGTSGESIELTVDRNRRTFQLLAEEAFKVESDCRIEIELFNLDGVSSGRIGPYNLRVTPDSPPELRLVSPADGHTMGPNGFVMVNVQIIEEVAIDHVAIHVVPPNEIELRLPPSEDISRAHAEQHLVEFRVEASLLKGLAPDSRTFDYFVVASDLKGQTAVSETRAVKVIPESELIQLVSDQLAMIQRRFDDIRDKEQLLATQTKAAAENESSQEDDILRIETEQQEIADQLCDSQKSIQEHLTALYTTVSQNRLSLDRLAANIATWSANLSELRQNELSIIERALREHFLSKSPAPLRTASLNMQIVADRLAKLGTQFERENIRRRVVNDLHTIRDAQRSIYRNTESVIDAMLMGVPVLDTMESLTTNQLSLARQLERLLPQIREIVDSSIDSDESSNLRSISDAFDKQELIQLMDRAARLLDRQLAARAAEQQVQILQYFDEMLGAVANSAGNGPNTATFLAAVAQLRTRQVSAMIAAKDLAESLSPTRPPSREQRVESDRLANEQGQIATGVADLVTNKDGSAREVVREYAERMAKLAYKNILADHFGDQTTTAMSSVVDSLDILLDAPSTPGGEQTAGSNGGSSETVELSLAVALQRMVNDRTLVAHEQLQSEGSSRDLDEEFRELANLQEQVSRVLVQLSRRSQQ